MGLTVPSHQEGFWFDPQVRHFRSVCSVCSVKDYLTDRLKDRNKTFTASWVTHTLRVTHRATVLKEDII